MHCEEPCRPFHIDGVIVLVLAAGAPGRSPLPRCRRTSAFREIAAAQGAVSALCAEHPGVSKMQLPAGGVLRATSSVCADQRGTYRHELIESLNLVHERKWRHPTDERHFNCINIAEARHVSLVE